MAVVSVPSLLPLDMGIHSKNRKPRTQPSWIEVDAVAARIGARVHLRIDPGVASAAERWADAEVLPGARI